MDLRLPARCVALIAAPVLMVASGTAAAAKPSDFGDAPDNGPAGVAPGDASYDGHFPARRRSNGARHSAAGKLRLGRAVDKERDSVQVDLDGQDDGFRSALVRCRKTSMFFRVNAKRLPKRFLTKRHKVYLNAWFDWNIDGDWRDVARCGSGRKGKVPEWRVQNEPVSLARFRKRRVRTIEVRVRAGPQVPGGGEPGDRLTSMWHRASITLDEKFQGRIRLGRGAGTARRGLNDGRGSFRHGETEDYATVPEDNADCDQGMTTHDKTVYVSFFFFGRPPKKVEVLQSPFDVREFGGLLPDPTLPGGAVPHPTRFEVGFYVVPKEDTRDPTGQVVSAVFRFTLRSGATVERECLVLIEHETGAFGGTPPPPGGQGDGDGGTEGDGGTDGGTDDGTPPPDGGTPQKCEDGVDNDGDGLVDGADPGCQTGPDGTYDAEDHGEDDVSVPLDCPEASQGKLYKITQNNVGSTLLRHLLRLGGNIVVEKASGESDFASGTSTLTRMCSNGTIVEVQIDWTVTGTTVVYDLAVTWAAGAGGGTLQAVAAANTR